jgi:hypothetical protein
MLQQHFVDLARRDFLAAAIDQLLDAGYQPDSRPRPVPAIAGGKPSADKRCRVASARFLITAK